MNTFPSSSASGGELSTSPDIADFAESLSPDAVQIASTASGFPLPNKQFTFNPKMWTFTLSNVSQADKETIMTFYSNNDSTEFYWENEQEDEIYTVCFLAPPMPKMQNDDNKNLWVIRMQFLQTAP